MLCCNLSSSLTKNWCCLQVEMGHINGITQQEMVSYLSGSKDLSLRDVQCVSVISTK